VHEPWSTLLIRLECRPFPSCDRTVMRIQLNGEAYELPDGATVADVLARLDLSTRRVAVELNLDIVPRSLHPSTVLHEGDQVEVVHAIGGG